MLYIVATPIGNLEDITLRAIRILKEADLIACEDTRHSRILLDRYGINKPLTSYFEHNKITKTAYLIKLLKEGKNIALISDAGTPGISDPGFNIIRQAIREKVPLTVIPGASALISALVISGMPTDKFSFLGFLPPKIAARQNRLKELKQRKETLIFYESPHRLKATLEDIHEIFGNIQMVLVRELTKKFEEVLRDNTKNLLRYFNTTLARGEFILLLNPRLKDLTNAPRYSILLPK